MNRFRRFGKADARAMNAIKRITAKVTGVPVKNITHTFVVISRPEPGNPNSVMVGGVPCEHMTEILELAIKNGETTRNRVKIPPCPHVLDSP